MNGHTCKLLENIINDFELFFSLYLCIYMFKNRDFEKEFVLLTHVISLKVNYYEKVKFQTVFFLQ